MVIDDYDVVDDDDDDDDDDGDDDDDLDRLVTVSPDEDYDQLF